MGITNQELLQKATLTSGAFGGTAAGQAPLTIEQADTFIELMAAEQVMLNDVHVVKSPSAKWQESIIDFSSRVARAGTEATRLASSDQVSPVTGVLEISTVLLRAEVPISDEVMEDNVAGQGFAQTVERTLASRFGFDVEDLMISGNSASTDPYYSLLDGWLSRMLNLNSTNHPNDTVHVYNAANDGQDYQVLFKKLLNNLPDRHKRNIEVDGRYYAPKRLVERYRDILAARGTPLGDLTLAGTNELRYQGILIVGVPAMPIANAATSLPGQGSGTNSFIVLANRNNLYAGFRRAITMETWRDPREGATSFIVTARVDAKVAVPDATSIASNVDVSV